MSQDTNTLSKQKCFMCDKQLTESSPKDTKVPLCSYKCMEDFCLFYNLIWLIEPTLIGVSV